jgi:PAS domain S-box-containing protein
MKMITGSSMNRKSISDFVEMINTDMPPVIEPKGGSSQMDIDSKVNILIVDDYKENLVAIESLLNSQEYNLILASSGDEALKQLLKKDFALILMDVKMPGMDGFETARYIKDRERTKDIPIIFITGHGDEKLVFDGYASGAVDYLFKPGDPVILKSKVAIFVELFKKNKALRRAEEKYRGIFQNAVEGIYQVSTEGHFLSANPALAKILKCETTEELISTTDIRKLYVNPHRHAEILQALKKRGSIVDFESEMRCQDGSKIWVCENARALFSESAELIGYEGFLVDISARKRDAERLIRSEKQLAAAQQIVHLGSWEWNITSDRVTWSAELSRIFGMQPGMNAATYERFLEFMHPEDRATVHSNILAAVGSRIPTNFEFRVLNEQIGSRLFIANVDVMVDGEGQVISLIGTAQDITEQRLAEEQIRRSHEQFRLLSAHLLTVREEERTKIAREIHDELGQSLTAIKFETSIIERDVAKMRNKTLAKTLQEKLDQVHKLINSTIQTVKNISSELRPIYLDLGVIPAIEWQSQEFQNRTGIQCNFSSEFEDIDLDREKSTVMFRILQEALTNVARHAQARNVDVDLKQENSHYVLQIMDDGKGIPETELANPKSLGLLGMRERAGVVKGDVAFNVNSPQGTKVTVRIPLS